MKRFLRYIAILVLCAGLTGCGTIGKITGIYSGPTDKNTIEMNKRQEAVEKQQAELEKLKQEISSKLSQFESNRISQGSVFVAGTGRALNKVTNPEPAVILAKDLNGMAAQALPKPPTDELEKMNTAVDKSLDTNKVIQAEGKVIITALEHKLADTEKQMDTLREKYERKQQALEEKLDKATAKMNNTADNMAVKANAFDEANSMWGSFKLFLKNTWKLLMWIAVLGVIWIAVKIVLAIYAPPIALGMNTVQGVASKVTARAISEIVQGGEMFKEEVQAELPKLLEGFKTGLYSAEEVGTKILKQFQTNHQKAQSTDTQQVIKQLTQ